MDKKDMEVCLSLFNFIDKTMFCFDWFISTVDKITWIQTKS